MATQYVIFAGGGSGRGAIFVNDDTTTQFVLPNVYVNATTAAVAATGRHSLPVLGAGAFRAPTAVDLFLTGAMFAGLLVKENPVAARRKLFTFGLGKPRG